MERERSKAEKKREMIGIILLAAPYPSLILIISFYAISSFVFAMIAEQSRGILLLSAFVQVVLSILGLLAILAIPLSFIVGPYLILTKPPHERNPKKH